METILASIRRIIREDDVVQPPAPGVPSEDEDDELLVLEPSMIAQPAARRAQTSPEETRMAGSVYGNAAQTAADLAAALFDEPAPTATPASAGFPSAGPVASAPMTAPTLLLPVVGPEIFAPATTHALLDAPADTLLAPQTRAAAAQSFAALHDAVRPEPPAEMPVLRSGGLTLEDIVRDEVRGQLKNWLDANLPELVERVVRQEIERLVHPA